MPELPKRLTGALSGRYFLSRVLGHGWNATVYLAEDIRAGLQVAMKVVEPELSLTLDPAPFLSTMRAMQQLSHPNVLRVVDAGVSEGVLYCVMELANAESLRERIHRDQHLEVPGAIRIARDVGEALDYAHARGVVHGSVKPENVLLAPKGTLLADFGFALALRRAGRTRFTARDLLPRRPHHLSPECARGAPPDQPGDVYALGVLVYEMLAGEPPFTGSSAEEVVARILTDEPEPLASRRPDVPATLSDVVQRSLAKRPQDRFPTAADLRAALAG